MIFKEIAMEYARFTEEEIDELRNLLNDAHKEALGPLSDFDIDGHLVQNNLSSNNKRTKKREQHNVVKDLMLALNLCHNVTPVYPNSDDPTEKSLQASSPDEVALVKFAETMGIVLLKREEELSCVTSVLKKSSFM